MNTDLACPHCKSARLHMLHIYVETPTDANKPLTALFSDGVVTQRVGKGQNYPVRVILCVHCADCGKDMALNVWHYAYSTVHVHWE